ncbi:MAG TPA: fibronectin type III domain-containing protein [Longimicrobiales bacterium]|nr:fibronectin type III domain-containing protein [Longimicrobiales bacterium]
MMNRLFHRTLPLGLIVGLALVTGGCDEDDPSSPGLSVPTGVTVTAISATSAQVTYNAVSGATSYIVQRADGTAGAFATVGTPSATTYDDSGLNPSSTYRYRVAASSGSNQSDFSTETSLSTPAEGPKVATISTDITADRTLYADTLYTLSGFIKVANGATLTIEAGTIIHGDFNTLGSSLFILRGARIRAMGTADAPIVFTSSRAAGQRQPGDWGGLIIVGNARINRGDPVILEGTGTGAANPEVNYAGGTDDADDSGELHYVRVEFAGYATAPDAELNSFTFAAVGSGTEMDHLQALAGLDDHFEWFGGTADAKYLVSYESGDDHFDMSEGFSGRLQYLIGYQSKVLIPRTGAGNVSSDPQGIENDGCAGANCLNGQLSEPFTAPLVANFTLIGTGPGVVDATSGGYGMVLRRGTAGIYVNGVVARWPKAALSLRDQASTGERITDGDLLIRNVLAADNASVFQTGQLSVDMAASAIEADVTTAALIFNSLPADPSAGNQFDWTPAANSPARSGGMAAFTGAIAARAGSFISGTAFRGAVDPNGAKWWENWTSYADN